MDLEDSLSRISIRRVTLILAALSASFTVLGIVTQMLSPGPAEQYTWTHVFDLDAEATLPAWFQSGMLLACAALLWLIGSSRRPDERFAGYWKFLAWVFVYLSADENATLHETLGFWISERFGDSMGVYAWLIPGLALVIWLGLASLKFIRHLPPEIRRGMLVAAVIYLMGAAGMEVIESRLDALWGTLPFSMLTVVEESLEMAGLVIFIHALLAYLKRQPKGPTLIVEP